MKAVLSFSFYTVLVLLTGCSSTEVVAPADKKTAEAVKPGANRGPASVWLVPTFSREELMRSKVLCKNMDKLTGGHSGVMKIDTKFSFNADGVPSEILINIELRNHGLTKKKLVCASGRAPTKGDEFSVYCTDGSPGVGWTLELAQSESRYALKNKLGYFRGSLIIPQNMLESTDLGIETLDMACIARPDAAPTPKDENYLIGLRHTFGHYEQEYDWVDESAAPADGESSAQ
jgi:hypothetical protein